MYGHHRWLEPVPDDKTAERQTASLAGIVIVLLLLVAGLFLIQQLHKATSIEDCLLAGRGNCAALLSGQR